ncbi:MAG: DUF302 domain-containing protein [Chloroflexi bacterium]|nr:DUF302 domain-containing protein [Chloroflexota bacterium]
MKKSILSAIVGFVLGIIFLGGVVFLAAPGLMITEDISPLNYEDTVGAIQESAVELGWKVPKTYQLDASVVEAGYDVLPATVIELCHPDHAGKVLSEDAARVVTSLMPCRIAVYETSDGSVIISRMNSGLVSKVFGGTVTEVMSRASAENEVILSAVLP